jgi:hypothetical protein
MTVSITPAVPHFAGFSEKQGLYPSNVFVCPACEAGVSFPPRVLSAASAARFTEASYKSKLKPDVASSFQEAYGSFVEGNKGRFVLDFHCPQCQAPYAIGFEWTEFHMADTRFFPISLWSKAK